MNTDIDPTPMTQLLAQKVTGATLKYGDPAVLLKPGCRATLIWLRSWRDYTGVPLKHEYAAFAHNDLGHFVSITVTSDQIEGVQYPATE